MKVCKACGENKVISDFYVNKLMRAGYLNKCISCVTKDREARVHNTVTNGPSVWVVEKACISCKIVMPRDRFSPNLALSDGLASHCRKCGSERMKKCRMKRKTKDPLMEKARELYNSAKQRATKYGLAFDLTIEWVRDIFRDTCPATGATIVYGKGSLGPCSPSLDKFDPSLGYTKDNTYFLSHQANVVKNSASEDQVSRVAEWLESLPIT